jgi:hypothetical protein
VRDRERQRERQSVCVCVCVCVENTSNLVQQALGRVVRAVRPMERDLHGYQYTKKGKNKEAKEKKAHDRRRHTGEQREA